MCNQILYSFITFIGHTGFVNSCYPTRRGTQLIVSGSDDCSIKVWDPRKKGKATTLVNPYQVLTVSFNDTAEQVFSSGIDNDIKVFRSKCPYFIFYFFTSHYSICA